MLSRPQPFKLTLACTVALVACSACAPTRMAFAPTFAVAAEGHIPPPPPELFLPANGRADSPIQVAELEAYAHMAALKAEEGRAAAQAVAVLSPAAAAASRAAAKPSLHLARAATAPPQRRLWGAKPAAGAGAPATRLASASAQGRASGPVPAHLTVAAAPKSSPARSRHAGRPPDLFVRAMDMLKSWSSRSGRFVLAAISHA